MQGDLYILFEITSSNLRMTTDSVVNKPTTMPSELYFHWMLLAEISKIKCNKPICTFLLKGRTVFNIKFQLSKFIVHTGPLITGPQQLGASRAAQCRPIAHITRYSCATTEPCSFNCKLCTNARTHKISVI